MSGNNDDHKEQRIGLWLAGGAAALSVLVILFYAIWGWETGKIEGSPNYGKTTASETVASEAVASEAVASAVIASEAVASAPVEAAASAVAQTASAAVASATVAPASASEAAASTPHAHHQAASETVASAAKPAHIAASAAAPAAAVASSPAAVILANHAPADADTAQVVVAENGTVKFYFAIGKADLAKDAQVALKDVLAGVKEGKKAVISGYHDSTGNAAQNQELSKQRAFAVRDALLRFGVPENQIELRKPENAEAGKGAEARRVEVILK